MAVQDRLTPRTIYLYLVCLAMVLVGVFAAGQLVRSALAIAYPDTTPSFGWTAYTPLDFLSEEQSRQVVEDAQRRPAIRDAVASGTTLLLAGGIYVLHWRRAQADRVVPAAAPEVPAGPPAP